MSGPFRRAAACLTLALLASFSPADADKKPLTRIAFGSCAHQDRPQPIWGPIVAARPELFLFAGDAIYADTEDMKVMRAKYARLAAMPGYQNVRATCTHLAGDPDYL